MAKSYILILSIVLITFTLCVSSRPQDSELPDYQPIPDDIGYENDENLDNEPIQIPILDNVIKNYSPSPSTSTDATTEVSYTSESESGPTEEPTTGNEGLSTISEEASSPDDSSTNASAGTTENDGVSTSEPTQGSVTSGSTPVRDEDETTTDSTGEEGTTSSSSTTSNYNPSSTDSAAPTTVSDGESTTEDEPKPVPVKERKNTWAVVLVAILITFAAFFTALYCFRKYMLRKRREDRKRLLGTSQEGFFVGNEYGGSVGSL